jgi:hypothetical protein
VLILNIFFTSNQSFSEEIHKQNPQDQQKVSEDSSKEKIVYFTFRLGQGLFRDDRSEIGKLGGGQRALDIKLEKYPVAISISNEYYTSSPDPIHSYEIADLTVINLLYMTKLLKSERANVFLGGGIGRLEVPKGENEPDDMMKGTMFDIEGGINVVLYWRMGFYVIGRYLYANKNVIDFSEGIVILGLSFNLSI